MPTEIDKESLRKQIFDEIQAQFETRLREVRRQKSEVEEELETVSERWRAERRRLNGEIDRLETALIESRESRKKAVEAKPGPPDPAEIAKLQAAAEEKFNKAAGDWDTE